MSNRDQGWGQVEDDVPFVISSIDVPKKATYVEVRVTDPKTGGQKGLKPHRYDLIPFKALAELALVYGRGCKDHGGKYDSNNWKRGYRWGLSIRSLFSHFLAWLMGEQLDPETGCHHMMHAAWHCFTLFTFDTERLGTDDRQVSDDWVECGQYSLPKDES